MESKKENKLQRAGILKEHDKEILESKICPLAEDLKSRFGVKSLIYSVIIDGFKSLWREVQDDKDVKLKFNFWAKNLEIVYGYKPKSEFFVIHTYLVTLVKLAVYFKLKGAAEEKNEIIEAINGKYFSSLGISNFTEGDFSTWILHHKIAQKSLELLYKMAKELLIYDFSQIDEDFFKELYEEIITRAERHRTGEYYTPEWLVQLILLEVMKLWKKNEELPKILDPACGSGTFLCNAIHLFKKKLKQRNGASDEALKFITNNVFGMDINPVASIVAKANYLMALGDLIQDGKSVKIPIYTSDSLLKNEIGMFDIIVGNPPWIVMRCVKNKEYQDFLKGEALKYNLLSSRDTHLFTQMEMATLFFCKCSDLYLKTDGIIGFVMPRSVLAGTIQHINFRRFETPRLKLLKILDLENVSPLFNMPSCVLIAKKGEITEYPVLAERYMGELPKKNAKLGEVKDLFSIEKYLYSPPQFPTKPSYYFDKFKVGASIFPRTLYFVDILSRIDNNFLTVKTSREIFYIVRDPWKVELEGKVEPKFLYATLLAWEILPFGYVKMRPIILPIEPSSRCYKLFNVNELKEVGFVGAADWFERVHKVWEEKRTEKSEKRFPRLIDRLNYNGLLTFQNPSKRYVVLYNATGTNVASCVVDKLSLPNFKISGGEIEPRGFIVDVKSWFYETNDKMEAYYLSAILNSDIVNTIIKPLQPKGLFGARAIHRRPLLFPIPKFDKNKESHRELARIGKYCHEKVKWMESIKTNNPRNHVRFHLKEEKIKIDNLVSEILKSTGG